MHVWIMKIKVALFFLCLIMCELEMMCLHVQASTVQTNAVYLLLVTRTKTNHSSLKKK